MKHFTASLKDSPTVVEVNERWYDEDSRHEYNSQINYRIRHRTHGGHLPCHLPPRDTYFLPFVQPRPDERYVDCGAYTGDTLALFLDWTKGVFDRYCAIEPDFHNFRKLKAYIATLPQDVSNRIYALPIAISNIDGQVPFIASGTDMSMIPTPDLRPEPCGSTEGSPHCVSSVASRTLDSLFQHNPPPTYIKMDIEGREPDAILGGSILIRLHSPVLAICTYHELDHLWLIPDLIHVINPDYKLFLRRYGPDHWETICYAVPPDRLLQQS